MEKQKFKSILYWRSFHWHLYWVVAHQTLHKGILPMEWW